MEISTLLAVSQNFIDFAVDGIPSVTLDWLGNLIKWLFDLFQGTYGGAILGTVIFTLILKVITSPIDIFTRVKQKKQSLLMKSMRPQMEKLQKQYANDKNMYSQKVMELQKAHGINPLGACLPMIVSIVIFMIVIGAFSTYSNFATLTTYNNMVGAYNGSVEAYIYATYSEEEAISLLELKGDEKPANTVKIPLHGETEAATYYVINENNFLIRVRNTVNPEGEAAHKDNYWLEEGSFIVDFDKFSAYLAKVDNSFTADKQTEFANLSEAKKFEKVASFVQLNARTAAADNYHENRGFSAFGWIGNVWYPDSMLNKEVPDFSNFQSSISRAVGAGMSTTYAASYAEVTYNLGNGIGNEMNTFNGYFVLVVLSIGTMFLQQFITMRAQKDANELSSVDGSAAKTNKWMMIMMPIIFGIFSFFYSAAFSVYMITSNVFSLVTSLVINKIVDVKFEKTGEAYLMKKKRNRQPSNAKRFR
ncbi:MAG: YidC/Oxa1 family membrane protein insertase [Clostridia bacterium]|nr:YidC/Oxa1 family membrane protein insertase [Clostridia bacterium]